MLVLLSCVRYGQLVINVYNGVPGEWLCTKRGLAEVKIEAKKLGAYLSMLSFLVFWHSVEKRFFEMLKVVLG